MSVLLKNKIKNSKNRNEIKKKKRIDGTLNYGRWVQVNSYPPLRVFRDDKWRFILENSWVTFTSLQKL